MKSDPNSPIPPQFGSREEYDAILAHYRTLEEYENARARFCWNDDDIKWPDGRGEYYTKDQVLEMQLVARSEDDEAGRG